MGPGVCSSLESVDSSRVRFEPDATCRDGRSGVAKGLELSSIARSSRRLTLLVVLFDFLGAILRHARMVRGRDCGGYRRSLTAHFRKLYVPMVALTQPLHSIVVTSRVLRV